MGNNPIIIDFDGYWVDEDKDYIHKNSGIYCVYTCIHHKVNDKVDIRALIYIGEADNVRERIFNHEKRNRWLEYVGKGDVLCFSFGDVDPVDR